MDLGEAKAVPGALQKFAKFPTSKIEDRHHFTSLIAHFVQCLNSDVLLRKYGIQSPRKTLKVQNALHKKGSAEIAFFRF